MSTGDDAKRLNEILYGGLSNDIEGPVNLILNSAEYLEKRFYDQPELLEIIHAIDDSGRYLARLGSHFIELAACFSGGNVPILRPVDLHEQLCYLLEETAPYAARRELTLHWDPDAIPRLYPVCDAVMLDNILLKLLSNAIRYTRPGGGIWAEVTVGEDETPRISIRDNGPGIPPQMISQVFSLRSPRTLRALDGGPGGASSNVSMDLFLANEFCRVLGWKLNIESAGEGGTTASIELCRREPDLSQTITFHSSAVAAEIFHYEQSERVRIELSPLFGRLPEQEKTEDAVDGRIG